VLNPRRRNVSSTKLWHIQSLHMDPSTSILHAYRYTIQGSSKQKFIGQAAKKQINAQCMQHIMCITLGFSSL
jgi:hypothetical protein